jgi:putative ABC transport system substrate-binding protein
MKRWTFIVGLGSAAAWPVVGQAQQATIPVIGFLANNVRENAPKALAALRKGMNETGFVEGQNVTIELFVNNANDRLREVAADLARRVTVIVASGLAPALAAKSASATIPIVFRTGNDPIQYGLVASLNRPGSNVTGVNDIGADLGPKRLGLLHELLPRASRFAALVNPTNQATESNVAEATAAASAIGRSIDIVPASTDREIDTAFASLVQKRIDALWVSSDALFFSRRLQLTSLAAYHRLPAIYANREIVVVGGLMSYGTNLLESFIKSASIQGASSRARNHPICQ